MLRLEKISKTYPTGEVLKNVSWEVKAGERVGLVGVNGAGKTTQLNIILGNTEPSSGEVIRPSNLNITCLSQEFDVDPQLTVRQELWRVFTKANEVQKNLEQVQKQMEEASPEELEKLINKLDRYQKEFEAQDGYKLDTKISQLLPELGFLPEDGERLVSCFSGGWQMRICLGKVMLQDPDVLLLDEPTNHLDLETIEWLEQYLKSLNTPMVIVSHDRKFLDRLCTQIVETERGVSTTYLGNYSSYLEQKEFNRQAQMSAYERQQKEIAKQEEFIERFRASATRSTQAKSREKQLEKVEEIEAPQSNVKTLKFRFPTAPRSGKEVVKIENLTHSFDDNILFLGANLLVERGDRVAFLGPNGSGKSTILRLIMGLETPTEGLVKLGEHNVIPGYFEQNQAEALDLCLTVEETIQKAVPDWKYEEIRALLGKFLFSGDTVKKNVSKLSGGEKARLALAKMLLQPVNLLILDEPTNHLDIPAKETIEEALQNYDGSALIVSHDRYFISQVATKIVEISEGELVVYEGDYNYYLEKKEEEAQAARLAAEKAQAEAKRQAKKEKQKEKEKARKAKKKKGH
ncbi:ABC-F family ATP-binding cassette domain-containing protein [Euhalothece natronophila Z-M001]|uniref:ABC-F family ATP-binding cassette domain-containing protein n=1 Tax=Euhalothece natronophila Z-M001 TaxID=522448 RepID=A0A5B8NQE2_9CHRO|nr:ABC-F family ATP-binding cassette domain-containing protein [Euhalothece natronophila]QDZ41482.1 ABC-F family ATP-binding cassette domain-containing protein [Euhalothece natronophila Z-M001]